MSQTPHATGDGEGSEPEGLRTPSGPNSHCVKEEAGAQGERPLLAPALVTKPHTQRVRGRPGTRAGPFRSAPCPLKVSRRPALCQVPDCSQYNRVGDRGTGRQGGPGKRQTNRKVVKGTVFIFLWGRVSSRCRLTQELFFPNLGSNDVIS